MYLKVVGLESIVLEKIFSRLLGDDGEERRFLPRKNFRRAILVEYVAVESCENEFGIVIRHIVVQEVRAGIENIRFILHSFHDNDDVIVLVSLSVVQNRPPCFGIEFFHLTHAIQSLPDSESFGTPTKFL